MPAFRIVTAASPACRREYAASCPWSACPRQNRAGRYAPPFFGAFDALTIDDTGRGAGFAFQFPAAFEVQRVMDAIQRAVIPPVAEITIQRAFWRQVFGNVTPLASRAQHIHHAVENFPHIDFALAPAMLRGWY